MLGFLVVQGECEQEQSCTKTESFLEMSWLTLGRMSSVSCVWLKKSWISPVYTVILSDFLCLFLFCFCFFALSAVSSQHLYSSADFCLPSTCRGAVNHNRRVSMGFYSMKSYLKKIIFANKLFNILTITVLSSPSLNGKIQSGGFWSFPEWTPDRRTFLCKKRHLYHELHAIQNDRSNPTKPLTLMHHVFYAEQLMSLLANKLWTLWNEWGCIFTAHPAQPSTECSPLLIETEWKT